MLDALETRWWPGFGLLVHGFWGGIFFPLFHIDTRHPSLPILSPATSES
jgi:hypothetical protein